MSISTSEVSLRNSKLQAWYRAIVLLGLLPMAGCIASAPGGGGGGQKKPILVSVSPSPQSVAVGAKQQFTQTLTNTTNQNVTWSLMLSPNSNSPATDLGKIDSTGMYTAPPTVPACAAGVSPCEIQVEVVATSQADSTASGQALANVHITISVSPTADTIGQGANLQFNVTLTGTPSGAAYQSVNWQAVCTACASGQGGGSFDPNNPGLYISAPFEQGVSTPQTISATATSAFDPTQFATATVTEDQTDPLGMISSGSGTIPCPTFGGGLTASDGTMACYQINTSCDQVADYSVYLKVNTPATPIGTVIFGTGSGGSALYDYDSPEFFYTDNGVNTNGGLAVVQDIFNAGFTTVQVSFGSPFNNAADAVNGWLQGPGGVRHLACRYATAANWVYQNIHNSSTTEPFCATGNSGGSGAIGYALSEYGLNSIFTGVELTSGPVMTRLDVGCSPPGTNYNGTTACTSPPPPTDMSYSPGTSGTASIIDTAYQTAGATTPTLCSDGVTGVNPNNSLRFQSDSIDISPSKSPPLPISGTRINLVFGGLDTSNAVPQGEWWWKSVGPTPTQNCVGDAPHAIPAAAHGDGVTQIVNDLLVGNPAKNIKPVCSLQ
jgi:hypothetical protein